MRPRCVVGPLPSASALASSSSASPTPTRAIPSSSHSLHSSSATFDGSNAGSAAGRSSKSPNAQASQRPQQRRAPVIRGSNQRGGASGARSGPGAQQQQQQQQQRQQRQRRQDPRRTSVLSSPRAGAGTGVGVAPGSSPNDGPSGVSRASRAKLPDLKTDWASSIYSQDVHSPPIFGVPKKLATAAAERSSGQGDAAGKTLAQAALELLRSSKSAKPLRAAERSLRIHLRAVPTGPSANQVGGAANGSAHNVVTPAASAGSMTAPGRIVGCLAHARTPAHAEARREDGGGGGTAGSAGEGEGAAGVREMIQARRRAREAVVLERAGGDYSRWTADTLVSDPSRSPSASGESGGAAQRDDKGTSDPVLLSAASALVHDATLAPEARNWIMDAVRGEVGATRK